MARHLQIRVPCGELPLSPPVSFIKYDYAPTRGIEPGPDSKIVFHGTYPQTAARILHTGQLLESVHGPLGMETHVSFPAVYTAETMDHALKYSWPGKVLRDNLYYSFMFELEVQDPSCILKRHKGEVLVRSKGLLSRSVFFINRHISQGQPRCSGTYRSDLELLPFPVGASLTSASLLNY